MADGSPRFPNELRARRREAGLTVKALAERTHALGGGNEPSTGVNARSLERLDRGEVRPQGRIAEALARALGTDVATLFPLGLDDPTRNPEGHTRITPGRPAPGRPRKKPQE